MAEEEYKDDLAGSEEDIVKAIEGTGAKMSTFGSDDGIQPEQRHFMDEGSWVIPYANLMTILMIFFMILYAYSILSGGAKYEKTMAEIQKVMGGSKEQIEKIQKQEQETKVSDDLEKMIKEKKLEEFAKVETSAQKIVVSLSNPVLFDSGSAELKDAAIPALKEIATMIKTLPNQVVVEGHTDNVPVKMKKYRSNFELSAARAFSVINYFIKSENVLPEQLSAYGYGEYKPVVPNDSEQNRAKNRRIEISIIRKS